MGALRKGIRGVDLSRFCAPLLYNMSGVPPNAPQPPRERYGPRLRYPLSPGAFLRPPSVLIRSGARPPASVISLRLDTVGNRFFCCRLLTVHENEFGIGEENR